MDFFYLKIKNRSWSPFPLQALTNTAFFSTKEGSTNVAAPAEYNPPKFTS